jgi:hypothetical protein
VIGRATHENWIDLHLTPIGASTPEIPPATDRSGIARFIASALTMFVPAGLIAYLLVAGDALIALIPAIPLIVLVSWTTFRSGRGGNRQ